MVKLTRIYTRGGDKGQTSLGDGHRIGKHSHRVEALGAVDEANAAIGTARLYLKGDADDMLARAQNDLFDLGADVCVPTRGAKSKGALRVVASQVERIEREIDRMNSHLRPLESFVLPAGSHGATHLHMARTVVRRAERAVVRLAQAESVNPEAIKYLNRLSDHLFVMARHLNEGGLGDVLWAPGGNR